LLLSLNTLILNFMRALTNTKKRQNYRGFTIVELVIVMVVIGILAALVIVTYMGINTKATIASIQSDLTNSSNKLKMFQVDNNAFPTGIDCSASPAANTICLKSSPNNVYYAFQIVNTTSPQTFCINITNNSLSYYVTNDFGPRPGSCPALGAPSSAPVITVGPSGPNVTATITNAPLTCATGTVQYALTSHINDSPTWTGYLAWYSTSAAAETATAQTATQGAKYGYKAEARCYISDSFTSPVSEGSENTYTKPITPPSDPFIATPATTVGPTTTWSWNPVSCLGNTTQYQYDYFIDGVSQAPANWKTPTVPTDTTISFSTAIEGHTYMVQVQARCHGTFTDSSWGNASNTVGYYRTVTYTLTTIAGSGGTVSAGGTYDSGSTQTITATPNANYSFSSWTGSTGCSGVASHTITMNANATCTANFSPITYTLTTVAGSGGTVSAGGTYNAGSTPTITATPNTYYSFSSWTGSTGCSGVASHTITMNANATCTANFTANAVAAPPAPDITGNMGEPPYFFWTWPWNSNFCETINNAVPYDSRYQYINADAPDYTWYVTPVQQVFQITKEPDWNGAATFTLNAQVRCTNTVTHAVGPYGPIGTKVCSWDCY
jgi:prepilin-type N-terminal cleavage/methylation domain-containing protein